MWALVSMVTVFIHRNLVFEWDVGECITPRFSFTPNHSIICFRSSMPSCFFPFSLFILFSLDLNIITLSLSHLSIHLCGHFAASLDNVLVIEKTSTKGCHQNPAVTSHPSSTLSVLFIRCF